MNKAIIFFILISANAFSYDIDSYVKKAISSSHEVKEYWENVVSKENSYRSALASFYIPSAYYQGFLLRLGCGGCFCCGIYRFFGINISSHISLKIRSYRSSSLRVK